MVPISAADSPRAHNSMAIVSVNEITGGRGTVNEKSATEYTRKFRVVTDSALVGSLAVRTANGVPRVGDIYSKSGEFDANSLANNVEANQDDENPRVWEVVVNYGPPSNEDEQLNPNPLLRPAVLSFGFSKTNRVVFKDIDGKGVLNSAGEYFDPPPQADDSRPLLSITRNLANFNYALAIDFQDAVNSVPFLGFAAKCVKVAGISASSQIENNVRYWSVTVEFEFRREGWQLEILDQGRNQIGGEDQLVPIFQRDKNGQPIDNLPVMDPVPLLNGVELQRPKPENVKFLPFKIYKELPFSGLGII